MANLPTVSFTHPVAWQNPVNMRATAALPAAGAWDATPTEQNVAGAGYIMLYFTYQEGDQAGVGAFDWQLQASAYSVAANAPAGALEWTDESMQAVGGVAAGLDTQSRVQAEYQTFAPTSANQEGFIYGPIHLAHDVERVRIPARESGVAGNPGVLQISMTCFP